ncbi:MAG: hypothetical protein WA823_07120 [Candidatus Acidiferrales bacterium]
MVGKKTAVGSKKKGGTPPPKKREAERDYSHRKLADKLGIRGEQIIAVIGVGDAAFLDELAERVPNFSTGTPQNACDLIFYAVEDRSDLPEIKTLARLIVRTGAIWAVYPKGQPQIRDTDIIAAAKATGLVDNKVCKFSETHTALRLCIPVAKR